MFGGGIGVECILYISVTFFFNNFFNIYIYIYIIFFIVYIEIYFFSFFFFSPSSCLLLLLDGCKKFEMIAAEKEKKKAEMPYEMAQVEHWKAQQGIRRLDISDSDAEKWEIK